MTGFFCIVTKPSQPLPGNFDIQIPSLTRLVDEKVKFSDSAWTKRFIIPKFLNDKVFKQDADVFICTDGLMLNARDLRNEYAARDNFDLIKGMYRKLGCGFVNDLRGDFSGFLHDVKHDIWHIFNNHIGSKPIFYFFDPAKQVLIFASEVKMVAQGMRQLGYPLILDERGAYCLLTFGWMLDDITLIESIHRLPHGSTLTYQGGKIVISPYYHLRNMPFIEGSDDIVVKELDARFRHAIKAEYDKDLEYGYNKHIVTLSGGLDSRMNLLFAKKLGYQDILAITFSQSGAREEKIANKVASDWGVDYLFHALDNGDCLLDIEESATINDGLVLYSGSSHLLSTLKHINFSNFGLLHTGLQGDPIIGDTYITGPNHTHNKNYGGTSKFLLNKVQPVINDSIKNYPNDEIFKQVSRGTNGMLNMYRMTEQFSEFASPFLHRDFMDYAQRIHPSRRLRSRIYAKWILELAPEAGKHTWGKRGVSLQAGEIPGIIYVYYRAIRKRLVRQTARDSMNPFDFWYRTNKTIQFTLDDYFRDHLSFLDKYPSLKSDAEKLYKFGKVEEKTLSLTLLAAMKLLGL